MENTEKYCSHTFVLPGSVSRPIDLHVSNVTAAEFTVYWNAPTNICSNLEDIYMYSVSTRNECGTCRSDVNTTSNNITCKNLTAGQKCHISVQTVLDCGSSEPATLLVEGNYDCFTMLLLLCGVDH